MNAMKNLLFVFTLLILLISAWSQEEAAAPARKSNLLSRRPVGGRALGKSASATTSTTTTAPPADEENYDGAEENAEDYDAAAADENGSDEPVMTTPAPKRQPLKLAVRPFRSNDDLLETLRRRQQDRKLTKKPPSYKPSTGEQNEEELQKAVPSTGYSPRNARKRYGRPKAASRKAEPKPVEESEQAIEEISEDAASALPATLAKRTVRSRYAVKRN